jgi:hypothetical protein
MKDELPGNNLDHNTLKKEWEGVTRSFSAVDFAKPPYETELKDKSISTRISH